MYLNVVDLISPGYSKNLVTGMSKMNRHISCNIKGIINTVLLLKIRPF